ncbi:unnamed protein product [Periconia digitata]|uniref:Uncharacterized protein n=1 Tax=Periconia digitata TaxID=1303443 RepID=A0A9W4UJZ5_9PLEO|nr:unnamed protein product [Periconia digitata]
MNCPSPESYIHTPSAHQRPRKSDVKTKSPALYTPCYFFSFPFFALSFGAITYLSTLNTKHHAPSISAPCYPTLRPRFSQNQDIGETWGNTSTSYMIAFRDRIVVNDATGSGVADANDLLAGAVFVRQGARDQFVACGPFILTV